MKWRWISWSDSVKFTGMYGDVAEYLFQHFLNDAQWYQKVTFIQANKQMKI